MGESMDSKMYNKIYYIVLIVLFFICTLFVQLRFFSNKLDFYWNYNFGLQISKGLLPYNDINFIMTPLLSFLTGGFLKVFGNGIIVYAVFMSLLKELLCFFIAKTSVLVFDTNDEYKAKKQFTFSFVLSNLFIYRSYYEYNFFSIFFLVLIIFIEVKNNKNDFKKDLLIGFLSGLSILSKQSIGLFVFIFVLIKPIIFKDDKKSIYYRLIGAFVPLSIFLIYLLLSNSLNNFFNYCVFGLSDFKKNTKYSLNFIIEVLSADKLKESLFIIIFLVYALIYILSKLLKKNNTYKERLILFYSLSSFSCIYPIVDKTHLIPAILPAFIMLCISFYNSIEKKENKVYIDFYKKIFIGLYYLLLFVIIAYPVFMYFNRNNNVIGNKYKYLDYFIISKSLDIYINETVSYEKKMNENGYDVIYLDKDAVFFHLVQDKYYKDYDLFMQGNFGKNGEDRLIEEINEKSNTLYLVKKTYDEDRKYPSNQIPEKVIDYILNNFNKIDEVTMFDVYSK